MNFNPVGINESGEYYMKFRYPFTTVDKINLLQRSILVQSFCYYELDNNLLSDFQYDANAMQLAELKRQHPDEFRRSRYHDYFYDYCSSDEGTHYTSGFDLLDRVKRKDKDLYHRLYIDASWALQTKQERGTK